MLGRRAATVAIRISMALAMVAGLLAAGSATSHAQTEPAYPSPEWFAREAANYAMTTQAPAEQAADPDFQLRWNEQSTENRTEYMTRRYVTNDWPWDSTGNACNHWSGPCTGDPYLYPGVDAFYEEEGVVEEVIYFDSGGALLSGRVWAPRGSEPGDDLPGVVIETGSVQAPETLYWWFAQSLVRSGYAVMTYEVRGQGRSDNRTPSGQPGTNLNSNVFATNLVDSIEFFHTTPDDPYPHEATREAPITSHNPFHDRIDRDRLGIVGHSLGATGVSVVQAMDPWPGRLLESNPVDVAVAWDNLSASGSLAGVSVRPRVPTMGQAGDYYLTPTPYTSPPDPQSKNAGFNRWRAEGVPTYQVNIRGGTHYEWSLLPGFPTTSWDGWGNPMANHYTLAWLDRWLKQPEEPGYEDADARLLRDDAWTDRMSFYFPSARFFPTRGGVWQDCADIAAGCEVPDPDPDPETRETTLTLDVVGNGANRTLVATLVDDETEEGIAQKQVGFFADGHPVGSAWTDDDGRATLSPPRPYHAGKRTYRAEFEGDDLYGGSASERSA